MPKLCVGPILLNDPKPITQPKVKAKHVQIKKKYLPKIFHKLFVKLVLVMSKKCPNAQRYFPCMKNETNNELRYRMLTCLNFIEICFLDAFPHIKTTFMILKYLLKTIHHQLPRRFSFVSSDRRGTIFRDFFCCCLVNGDETEIAYVISTSLIHTKTRYVVRYLDDIQRLLVYGQIWLQMPKLHASLKRAKETSVKRMPKIRRTYK